MMDKCYTLDVLVMDGPEPLEQRSIVAIARTFSCPLEYHLHELNQYLLLRKRLGWTVFA